MSHIDKDSIDFQFGRIVEIVEAQGDKANKISLKIDQMNDLLLRLPCKEHAQLIELIGNNITDHIEQMKRKDIRLDERNWWFSKKIIIGIIVAVVATSVATAASLLAG